MAQPQRRSGRPSSGPRLSGVREADAVGNGPTGLLSSHAIVVRRKVDNSRVNERESHRFSPVLALFGARTNGVCEDNTEATPHYAAPIPVPCPFPVPYLALCLHPSPIDLSGGNVS